MAAAPADDGPRHVLSDALLERGDVRGEFIALQLLQARGTSTPRQDERAKILEGNHWRRWLIELPGVGVAPLAITPLNDFHRGFLRSCVLSPTGIGADSPTWRMVERIELATPGDARELAAPALTRLAVLHGLEAGDLQIVLDGPDKPRLHELGFVGPWSQGDRGRQEQRLVLALTRFPSLRALRLWLRPFRHHADWLAWLFEAPLLRQLERLTLWMDLPFDVAGLNSLLQQHRLKHLKLELANEGVTLRMDTGWLTVRFDNPFWLGQRAQAMRNLAPHFAPFPYPRFDVQVGERKATREELTQLGEVFTTHVSLSPLGGRGSG